MFRKQGKGGALIVDAALSMPVFIIAMGMLLSLVKLAGTEDGAFTGAVRAASVNTAAIATLNCTDYSYGETVQTSNGLNIDHVLSSYAFTDKSLITVKYRPFVGESKQEDYSDSSIVYIFPKRGEKYHIFGCQTMKEGCIETVLTANLKRKYSACRICRPDALSPGSCVYMFSGSSSVYHRKSCASITKTYESIAKCKALEMGYTACLLCGGGE